MAEHTAYIGIGSNLGHSILTVQTALARLDRLPHSRLNGHSSLYRTAPVDAGGNDYINAVACLLTALTPRALLAELQRTESESGRERSYKNAPRTLDLDILLYDSLILTANGLDIPHPRMSQRAFVLIPLLEIAPDIIIPGKGVARDFLQQVEHQSVTRLHSN